MKKLNFLLIMLTFIFLSCENIYDEALLSETEVVYHNDSELKMSPSTRAEEFPNSTEYIPDILDQIANIPVNIMKEGSYGAQSYNYLSVQGKKYYADLWTHDDGSMRQRFYIKEAKMTGHYIQLVGGHNSGRDLMLVSTNKEVLLLELNSIGTQAGWVFRQVDDCHEIYQSNMGFPYETKYLQPSASNASGLIFSPNRVDAKWKITPVEKFQLIGIRYFKYGDEGDYVIRTHRDYVTYSRNNLYNNKPVNIAVKVDDEVSISVQYTQTSGLSMTNKVTNSSTTKVDGPHFKSDNTLTTEYSTGSTYNATTSVNQTSKVTFKTEQDVECPPYKYARVHVKLTFWTARLTYYAQYKCGNKIIYVKGKFNGTIGRDTEIDPVFYDYIPN